MRNYSGNAQYEANVGSMLVGGESLQVIVQSSNRFITVTNRRIILHENSGNYSTIRLEQLAAIEVSDGAKGEMFIKLLFGGGLSRTVSAPNAEQAAAIVNATACR